jgi:hypothetical protein
MSLANTAVEIAEEFGAVFPCEANKAPLTAHGFKDASDDPDKIYELFSKAPEAALIGIATGDIIAIDIDLKNGKDGFRWPALAELPFTRAQRTPSGGEHRLYRVPSGRRLRCSQNAVYPGIDIRGDGGYIATGAGYQWINKEDIAELSVEQCDLLSPLNKAKLFEHQGVTAEDIAGIDTGNWHEPMLRKVGMLVAKGLDDATIHAITDRFTSDGYTIAQTRSEVAEMIRGARDKGWAPEVPETRYPPLQNPLDVFTAEPPEWRVDGMLPKRGVGIIVGGEGSGKTFVAIDIAMAVANGTPFAKNHPTQGGRVLYSAAEDRHGVGSRIVAHHQWSTLSVSNIALWQGISLVDLKDIEYLEQTGERFDLVIIDTLSKATPGLDENSNSEMAGAIDRAYQLSAVWDCFVLLVAHTGKEAGKGVRGASSITANVDTVLKCVRPGRGSQVSLTLTKQKSGPEDAAVDFALEEVEVINPRTGEVSGSLVVRPTKASAPDMCRRALASEHDLTAKAVFDRVTRHFIDPSNPDVTLNAVKAALSRMVSAGEAINNAGKYSLTAGGEDE